MSEFPEWAWEQTVVCHPSKEAEVTRALADTVGVRILARRICPETSYYLLSEPVEPPFLWPDAAWPRMAERPGIDPFWLTSYTTRRRDDKDFARITGV